MFEVYHSFHKEKQEKSPIVSLSKNSIVLNKVAREKIGNECEKIEVAFDRENNVLRLKSDNEKGLVIKKTKVFSKNVFKFFGIEKKGRFNAIFRDDEGALYVNLNKKPAI